MMMTWNVWDIVLQYLIWKISTRSFPKLEKYQTYYWSIQTNDGTEIGGTRLNGILKDELINLDGEIKKINKKYLYKKIRTVLVYLLT